MKNTVITVNGSQFEVDEHHIVASIKMDYNRDKKHFFELDTSRITGGITKDFLCKAREEFAKAPMDGTTKLGFIEADLARLNLNFPGHLGDEMMVNLLYGYQYRPKGSHDYTSNLALLMHPITITCGHLGWCIEENVIAIRAMLAGLGPNFQNNHLMDEFRRGVEATLNTMHRDDLYYVAFLGCGLYYGDLYDPETNVKLISEHTTKQEYETEEYHINRSFLVD